MKVAYVGNEIFLPPENSEVDKYAFNDLSIGEKENEYDLIYSTNSLPEVERKDVIALLEAIYKALKPGGELCIAVPSAEYAGLQLYKNNIDEAILFMLYGNSQGNYHCCYTMLVLRSLLERARFVIKHARNIIMELTNPAGEKIQIPVNEIICTKLEAQDGNTV